MTAPFPHRLSGTRRELPEWWRRPGESWIEWDRRLCDEKAAENERLSKQPLDPLYSGSLDLTCGIGTFDSNGNPKGYGW